jgi:hypothetical protein
MVSHLQLGDIAVRIVRKNIKNVHLGVYPPAGGVRIAAPTRMSEAAIRVLAISKLGWIKQQRKAFQAQERETARAYVSGESHYLWGKRYLLTVEERPQSPAIAVKHSRLVLRVRPDTAIAKRQVLMDDWYRQQVKQAVPSLLAKWESRLGVKAARFLARRMRTKWGSCNAAAGNISLNSDLAKKPPECLEYIVVHELAHLIEPTHNARFVAMMDRAMPHWQHHRRQLNRLPVRHEDWRC